MAANRNIQAVAFRFFFFFPQGQGLCKTAQIRECSDRQFSCPVPQKQQVPGRAQVSILILKWVLQPQMCSVLLYPYCQQHLFSEFRENLSIFLCSTKHIYRRPARFVLLPLSSSCLNRYSSTCDLPSKMSSEKCQFHTS